MAWADWAILGVLAFSVFGGMAQGFVRSAFSLAGLVLGFVLATWNYTLAAKMFNHVVPSQTVANAIGFVVIAILVMLAAAVLGGALQRMFRWAGLGCLDTLLGGIFGFLQGVMLVIVFVLVTVAFFPGASWFAGARLPQLFFGAAHLSIDISPKGLEDKAQDSLRKLKKDSPEWMHPSPKTQ